MGRYQSARTDRGDGMTSMEWLYLVGFLAGLTIVLYVFGVLFLGNRR